MKHGCKVITNDEMRDHHFQLLSPRLVSIQTIFICKYFMIIHCFRFFIIMCMITLLVMKLITSLALNKVVQSVERATSGALPAGQLGQSGQRRGLL